MKTILSFLLCTCFIIHCTFSQDTLRYEQVADTLVKQRFIDRYDYVFMTKEPTKWMIRVQSSTNLLRSGLNLSYEQKLSPSFGIEIGGFAKYLSGVSSHAGFYSSFKFYYDLKKRIAAGKSANNFSANYVGLSYNKFVQMKQNGILLNPGLKENYAVSIDWALQRRFLHNCITNIGLSLSYINGHLNKADGTVRNWDDVVLHTNWSLGFTFGDYQKSKKIPLCDVFRCYDTDKQLLKVFWPQLELGLRHRYLNTVLSYEIGIPRRLSFNLQTNFNLSNSPRLYNNVLAYESPEKVAFTNWYSFIQPRVYLSKLSKQSIDPLSGIYVGASFVHGLEKRKFVSNHVVHYHGLEFGPTVGVQQRLFKRLFIDIGATVTKTIHVFDNSSTQGGINFRYNFGMGFAF